MTQPKSKSLFHPLSTNTYDDLHLFNKHTRNSVINLFYTLYIHSPSHNRMTVIGKEGRTQKQKVNIIHFNKYIQ